MHRPVLCALLQALPTKTGSACEEESQKKISALKAFVQREGHADVPSSHEDARLLVDVQGVRKWSIKPIKPK